eukprot:SAG31_NODE_3205_length_4555_cov_4.933348_4_plen_134_part_00
MGRRELADMLDTLRAIGNRSAHPMGPASDVLSHEKPILAHNFYHAACLFRLELLQRPQGIRPLQQPDVEPAAEQGPVMTLVQLRNLLASELGLPLTTSVGDLFAIARDSYGIEITGDSIMERMEAVGRQLGII